MDCNSGTMGKFVYIMLRRLISNDKGPFKRINRQKKIVSHS